MKLFLFFALFGSAHAGGAPERTLDPWGVPVRLLPPAPPPVTIEGIPLADVHKANPIGPRTAGVVILGVTGAFVGTLLLEGLLFST